MSKTKNIFVALDNMTKDEVLSFLEENHQYFSNIKLGLEMFCLEGPSLIQEIYDRYQHNIFLDMKLHDIPNTVSKSVRSLSKLPIKFLTLHLTGGKRMIEDALTMAKETMPDCNILGVSYLTSLNSNDFNQVWGVEEDAIKNQFDHLFKLALETKIHGLVLSPLELAHIRALEEKNNHKLIKICPGVRFQDEIDGGNIGDQSRVMNPENSFKDGANYLVMGRSLTQAKNLKDRVQSLTDLECHLNL